MATKNPQSPLCQKSSLEAERPSTKVQIVSTQRGLLTPQAPASSLLGLKRRRPLILRLSRPSSLLKAKK